MNTRNIRFKSNRVRDILGLFHEELDALYGPGEVTAFGEMLFEAFLGWDRVRLLTSREQTVNQSDLLRLHWALEDLKRQRPIQHIIGHTDFCGYRIAVGPEVLIPRPETEEIVNRLITHLLPPTSHLQPHNILDLCTGSGCIAIALKKAFCGADVTAVDISPTALAIARQNAENNGVEVRFLQADVLHTPQSALRADSSPNLGEQPDGNIPDIFANKTYSLIVSNPPYVRNNERAQMHRNVLDYEPGLALFVPDDDPLRFYRAIARIAQRHLAPDGLLALEINEALASDTCTLLLRHGFDPTVHRDFRGRDRMVTAIRTR
ncbi:MAG: peptide chain release factor N(5)-glutamine methyltransferase [Bacteroidales bacterium]|nr:peptide chain release factor N(5)-glutamine methyltransferase [Bacteroidales bacterium]